jgi:hypothetical protein
MNRQQRKEIGEEVMRINRRYEQKYFPRVVKALQEKVNNLITVIERDGQQAGVSYLIMDMGNERLSSVVRDLYQTVGLRHASRTWSGLRKQQREAGKSSPSGKGFGLSEVWVQIVMDYLERFLLEKITYKVAETTREFLLGVLQESIREGKGIDEIVRQLKELPFTRFQAARIVRTEIKRAGEAGAKAASGTFEYEQEKVWVSLRDRRTRGVDPEDHADHFHMDGQTVGENEKFFDSRSGVYLDFPGDPEAAPKDTINCRCSHAYVLKRDENDRLIKRRSRVFIERNFNNNSQVITI